VIPGPRHPARSAPRGPDATDRAEENSTEERDRSDCRCREEPGDCAADGEASDAPGDRAPAGDLHRYPRSTVGGQPCFVRRHRRWRADAGELVAPEASARRCAGGPDHRRAAAGQRDEHQQPDTEQFHAKKMSTSAVGRVSSITSEASDRAVTCGDVQDRTSDSVRPRTSDRGITAGQGRCRPLRTLPEASMPQNRSRRA